MQVLEDFHIIILLFISDKTYDGYDKYACKVSLRFCPRPKGRLQTKLPIDQYFSPDLDGCLYLE